MTHDAASYEQDTGAGPLGGLLPALRTPPPGPRSVAWVETLARVECPALTARRRRRGEQSGASHDPIVWTHARGANVVDADGNVYVDLVGGFGVALLGHASPPVVSAVQAQSKRLLHAMGDVHPSDVKIALESRLAALGPWGAEAPARVVLGLSGSDAVEVALKTAVLATGRHRVLAFEGGYHGLSYGPLRACGYKDAFRTPFAPQLGVETVFVPYPDADDAEACRRTRDHVHRALAVGDVAAVVLEPIRGRGGVAEADPGTVDQVVEMARSAGAVTVADEIYTGLRRTAPAWTRAAHRWSLPPDVVCLGKALGGGLPVSACLAREEVARAWGDPDREALHTSTFLGNPLTAAAALASLDALAEPAFDARVEAVGRALQVALSPLCAMPSGLTALRRHGLLLGLEVSGGGSRVLRVVAALLARGFITLGGGLRGEQLVLTPPSVLTTAQIDAFASALRDVLERTP